MVADMASPTASDKRERFRCEISLTAAVQRQARLAPWQALGLAGVTPHNTHGDDAAVNIPASLAVNLLSATLVDRGRVVRVGFALVQTAQGRPGGLSGAETDQSGLPVDGWPRRERTGCLSVRISCLTLAIALALSGK